MKKELLVSSTPQSCPVQEGLQMLLFCLDREKKSRLELAKQEQRTTELVFQMADT